MTALKIETSIIATIAVNLIGRTLGLVITNAETFKTDISLFIGNKRGNHTDCYVPV